MALSRITITIPSALLKAADRRARQEDRSRSRIIADALRRQLAESPATVAPPPGAPPVSYEALSREAARVREVHVAAELSLTPAERLARADELSELARERQGRAPREQVIAFDAYDDYYRWKLTRRIGG